MGNAGGGRTDALGPADQLCGCRGRRQVDLEGGDDN